MWRSFGSRRPRGSAALPPRSHERFVEHPPPHVDLEPPPAPGAAPSPSAPPGGARTCDPSLHFFFVFAAEIGILSRPPDHPGGHCPLSWPSSSQAIKCDFRTLTLHFPWSWKAPLSSVQGISTVKRFIDFSLKKYSIIDFFYLLLYKIFHVTLFIFHIL